MKLSKKWILLSAALFWAALSSPISAAVNCDDADQICLSSCGADYPCWHACMVGYDCDSNPGLNARTLRSAKPTAVETKSPLSLNSMAADQCSDIISYCYSQWWITRHNYEQYVGCVINNAAEAGVTCNP